MKRWVTLVCLIAILATLVVVPSTMAADKLKIALVHVSTVGDKGWTWSHDQARLYMEVQLGDKIETAYSESVPEGPEAERVIRDYAKRGYRLIFTTSFGFGDPTIAVAAEFPDVWFIHVSGYQTAPNVSTIFGRIEQSRYLSGLVAGVATKTNILGFVAAFPIPEVIRGINAFTLGVREVNPQAEVRVIWTNTWYNPQQEKEAAEALLASGADVIAQHQDTTEPQKAAADAGALSIGYDSDMRQFVGDTVLTSPVWNWGMKYTEIAEQVIAGTYKGESFYGGFDTGIVDLAPLSPLVAPETAALVARYKEAITANKWDVFCGKLVGQNDVVVQTAGKCLTDAELLSMDYFLAGVSGEAPKLAEMGHGVIDSRAEYKFDQGEKSETDDRGMK